MNKNIGIIVAMQGEYEGIVKEPEDREILDKPFKMYARMRDDTKIITLVSGVGKIDAACATQYMIENFAPQCIINVGVCGATKEAFEECDTPVITYVVNSDFDTSAVDGDSFVTPSKSVYSPEFKYEENRTLYTADHFTTVEPVIDGERASGYFDMEGYAVAHVSQINSTKCILIKSVTDVIKTEKQDEQYNCNYNLACERARKKLSKILNNL